MKNRISSHDKIRQSQRNGERGTIYGVIRKDNLKYKDVIRDKNQVIFPFETGSNYKGEWKNDMKHGFGTEISPDGSTYSGQWLEDYRHGRGTLWIKKGNKSVHQYVGEWYQGQKEGYGVHYYDNGDEYKGDWKSNKRNGNGRLDYVNGDYYMGEWENDYQNGYGTYHYNNGNTFEGVWMNGRKEGRGRYFYASTKKVYEAEWVDDQPRCGEFREPLPNEESRFGPSTLRKQIFCLPTLALQDSNQVIELSIAEIRSRNIEKRGIAENIFDENVLEEALKAFDLLDTSRKSFISIYATEKIFEILGLSLSRDVLKEIMRQVDYDEQPMVTFVDIVDIASCLVNRDDSI